MHHDLKVYEHWFEPMIAGDKAFEIRNNNGRDFQRGDTVCFAEGENGVMTGRWIEADIAYVTSFQQQKEYVVFGFKITNKNILKDQSS